MKIKPIKTVFNGFLTELKIITNGFDVEKGPCTLTGTLHDEAGTEISALNYTLTEEEYNNWGSSDNYLFEVFANFFEKTYAQKIEFLFGEVPETETTKKTKKRAKAENETLETVIENEENPN